MIPINLGRDPVDNEPVDIDLATAPHLIIAGTTGSGKSTLLNHILAQVFAAGTADAILVDPKRVELARYNKMAATLAPVAYEVEEAIRLAEWLNRNMDHRFKNMEWAEVRDLDGWNARYWDQPQLQLRPILYVVDELASLMLSERKRFEPQIVRLATMGRAAGIHLILATQRPAADVLTGLIRANIPMRIALPVISATESRIILDMPGAEMLERPGQMLIRRGRTLIRADAPRLGGEYLDAVGRRLRQTEPAGVLA